MIDKKELLRKIESKELKVGVVGLGYVGLPLAVEKAKSGFRTIGFDIQSSKVDMVNRGENYIGDIVDADLVHVVSQGMLSATTDISFLKTVDFIAICVPTPLDEYQQPDISYIRDSATAIGKNMKSGCVIVLESTTYPGTTEEFLQPLLEKESGLQCGEDFYLGFSPERVDPGNLIYKTKNTPKVVGGIGSDATQVIAAVYRSILNSEVFETTSPKVAEMEKILENTYRNINIALINEMAIICERMNINIWEVIEAAKTKPYGFSAFYPGPGLGGHCIPLDPYYLTWKAREYDYHTRLIETAGEINSYMPQYVVERCSIILNERKKALNGSKILILGIAYKQNISDYRESPALRVISILEKDYALVDYYDSYVKTCTYKGVERNSIVGLSPEVVAGYDMVVITTGHDNVDYNMVQKSAKVVFDTKNAMKYVSERQNIVLL